MEIMWRQGENIKSMENESEEKMQRRNKMDGLTESGWRLNLFVLHE
jgi:hypothetical protein